MVTVAAVQATPAFLDLEATTDKVSALVKEAAEHGAELIVFRSPSSRPTRTGSGAPRRGA